MILLDPFLPFRITDVRMRMVDHKHAPLPAWFIHEYLSHHEDFIKTVLTQCSMEKSLALHVRKKPACPSERAYRRVRRYSNRNASQPAGDEQVADLAICPPITISSG